MPTRSSKRIKVAASKRRKVSNVTESTTTSVSSTVISQAFVYAAGRSPLETLPTEVFCMVVHELPSVPDVAHLSQVSKSVKSKFDDDAKGMWCRYFRSVFESSVLEPNARQFGRCTRMYRFLMQGTVLPDNDQRGLWTDKRTFAALQLLLTGALKNRDQDSVNFATMTLISERLHLFNHLFRPTRRYIGSVDTAKFLGPLLLTMLHVGLDVWTQSLTQEAYGLADSRVAAYGHPCANPIFIRTDSEVEGLSITMMPHATNLLLIANFFRKHLVGKYARDSAIPESFFNLPENLRPQPWLKPLNSGVDQLCGTTYWKGCYAWTDEAGTGSWRARGAHWNDAEFQAMEDDFDEDDLVEQDFFDLRLDCIETGDERVWPVGYNEKAPLCEEAKRHTRMDSNGLDMWTRRCDVSTPIIGFLNGMCNQCLSGNIHDLAETSGIRGFKRVSFVTFPGHCDFSQKPGETLRMINKNNRAPIWVYEGVIMPGGNIMVGRWWFEPAHYVDSPVMPTSFGDFGAPEVPLSSEDLSQELRNHNRNYNRGDECLVTGPFLYWRVAKAPVV